MGSKQKSRLPAPINTNALFGTDLVSAWATSGYTATDCTLFFMRVCVERVIGRRLLREMDDACMFGARCSLAEK